ncbi:MAG: hypothetical protein SNJ60_05040, partial [Pseudanabaenaceae cyanobacterium]
GTARLPDGTLAGTTVSLPQAVQNLVAWGICDQSQAIATVTTAPQSLLVAAPTPSPPVGEGRGEGSKRAQSLP